MGGENDFEKALDLYKKIKDKIFRGIISPQKMASKSPESKEANLWRRTKFRTLENIRIHLGWTDW